MDKGFATPADAPGLGPVLPPVRVQPYRPPLASTLVPANPPAKAGKGRKAALSTVGAQPVADHHPLRGGGAGGGFTVLFLFVGSTGGIVVLLRQRAERRRKERTARRRRLAEIRRQAYLVALNDDDWDVEIAI